MNTTERALVDYLSKIKAAKIGFISLKTDVPGWCADIDLDGRYSFFAPQCIFDDCSDAQAKQFLEGFLKSELAVGWSVSKQLCKLLSKRGSLVSSIMDQLLTSLDWTSCSMHQLFLSYLTLRVTAQRWP